MTLLRQVILLKKKIEKKHISLELLMSKALGPTLKLVKGEIEKIFNIGV